MPSQTNEQALEATIEKQLTHRAFYLAFPIWYALRTEFN